MRHVLRPNEQEGPPHLGAAILLLLSMTRIKATLISITLPSVVDKWCEILDRVDTVTTVVLGSLKVATYWPIIFLLIPHLFAFSCQISNK